MLPRTDSTLVVDNALMRYDREVRAALADLAVADDGAEFDPGYDLPPASEELTRFLAPSELRFSQLGDYRGRQLTLLDLTRNPRTRTTKTFASLVIVARAVEYVRRTGEQLVIVSPSSGNKATALRDAVLRAYEAGLVTPEQLGILVIVPKGSSAKLWSSPLSEDPLLRARNPVVTYDGARPGDVKTLARSLVDGHGATLRERFGARLWYTLNIDNYKAADVVRAYAEHEHLPHDPGRLHVHAVSSAFGLLGHDLGASRLAAAGHGESTARYFLVQHLDTPDMVLSLHFGSTSRRHIPDYRLDESTGLYHQDSDRRFPATTFDPAENLDPTFYTRSPATSAQMNSLIRTRGGGGIVVSLHECLQRYPRLRSMLEPVGITLPADPRDLREWSLVMALTGILTAIDRNLVDGDDILVHASGSYQRADFDPIPAPHLTPVGDVGELAEVAARALSAQPSVL